MKVSEITNIEIEKDDRNDLVDDEWEGTNPDELKKGAILGKFRMYRVGAIGEGWVQFWLTDIHKITGEPNPVGYINLSKVSESKKAAYRVGYVRIKDEYQGQGLGLRLYKWLIGKGITLVSDASQSPGGKSLWTKLYQTPGIHVYGWRPKDDQFTTVEFDDLGDLAGSFDIYDSRSSNDDLTTLRKEKQKEIEKIKSSYSDAEAEELITKIEDEYERERKELVKVMSVTYLVATKE